MTGSMNQVTAEEIFSIAPDLTEAALTATLDRLLVAGEIGDNRLAHYAGRLARYYRNCCTTSPVPLWGGGLAVTPEMRRQAEVYLPLAVILPAFSYLLRRACRYEPYLPAAAILAADSWYDALSTCRPLPVSADPAALLRQLVRDDKARQLFLAAQLVPERFGGSFGRYSGQLEFLQDWLGRQGRRPIRILDGACGSGELCYELAELLLALALTDAGTEVVGLTIERLELVAAAHGWFPHDPERAVEFRARAGGCLAAGGGRLIRFVAGDLRCGRECPEGEFDLVICNGLLGGPLLHGKAELAGVVAGLAGRMKKGGLLVAADRFHDGWRRAVPRELLEQLLGGAGLRPVACPDGLAAIRP